MSSENTTTSLPTVSAAQSIKDGWFSEVSEMWPGQAQSLKVDKILYHQKSQYQDILVFNNATYGNVLVLDGAIQVTDKDEFSYQEMIAQVPICSHKKGVKRVLVIGGGDGGVVREALRHPDVEEVHLCEIDQMVVETAKQYFPQISCGLSDKRVQIHYSDGAKFLKENKGKFDVVIVDSSDPIGPAETLFQREFYQNAFDSLAEGGILCTQAESIWLHLSYISNMAKFIKEIFPVVEYASTSIPTYPSGIIGFFVCSKDSSQSCKKPIRQLNDSNLRYYSSEIHEAAFVLPPFAKKELNL